MEKSSGAQILEVLERMTTSARRVVFFGHRAALQRGAQSIEEEHLLIGLIREDPDLLHKFLGEAESVEQLKKRVEAQMPEEIPHAIHVELPLAEGSSRVLLTARAEAEELGWKAISPACLLLSLLKNVSLGVSKILDEQGLHYAQIKSAASQLPPPELDSAGQGDPN